MITLNTQDIEKQLNAALADEADSFAAIKRTTVLINTFVNDRLVIGPNTVRLLDSYNTTPKNRHAILETLLTLLQQITDHDISLDALNVTYSHTYKSLLITNTSNVMSFSVWLKQLVDSGHTVSSEVFKLADEYDRYTKHINDI